MRRLILLSLLALAAARYVDDYTREKRDIEYHEWLTESQKSELKALKESADSAALKKRTMELYEALPADQKEKWNKQYKDMCVAWIKEVATEEETAAYKTWKAEGKMEEITAQYKKLKERLSEEKRKDVDLWETECWNLWKDEFPAASRGRRAVMDLAQEKLSFLGADKLAELKALKESGASDDVIRDKVVTWTLEHWKSTDSKTSTADFVKKCYGWIKDVTAAEEYEAFEKLHHTDHEACRVKVREFLSRLPADKQTQVEKSLPLCDAIWYKQHQEEHGAHAGHGDHDHSAHKHHVKRHLNTMHIEKFMTWLSKEQKEEIHRLEKGGESYESLIAKMKGWYDALESDKKDEVRELIKDKCADWVFAKTTETEQYELREFIQEGDKDGLLTGLKAPYSRLTDEEKHEVEHTKDLCITVWTTAPSRKRRDHHEEYKEYFSWLTPEQGAEVKALRDAGKHEEVYTKMNEFYAALETGEKKSEATEKLKGACKHYFKSAFGADAVEELKAMKESGSSMDDIAAKVAAFIDKITDEKKKAVATRASANCKKIFSASRRRREHNPDTYKEYFTWMTPEQGAEVKALREAGDLDGAYAKMNGFYDALAGDKKNEATEKLKGGCKHFFKDTFGEAAVEEVKQMKEAGSSMDEIGKKVEDFISKITDEKKKVIATKVSVNCKKIFSASRRRRDHAHNSETYKEYFTWMTPEQGASVKALRESGDLEGAYAKMNEFYDALVGDQKHEATVKLKGGCKHFFKDTFGEAAMAEIKAMKESGTSVDDIAKKVEEMVGKITDEKKKAIATKVSVNCKKIFSASRRRRDHAHNSETYKEYFTWMTPEQGASVKALREAGDLEGAYAKMNEYYDALAGDKKSEATEKLKGGCKHFFKDTFGEAAVEEVKQMKEAGSSMDEIGKKVEDFISKITDEKKKVIATKVSVNCKKIFSASRKRRDHAHNSETYKEYFTWMTPEQGASVKALREAGDLEGAYAKMNEYYDALVGDQKHEATVKLKGGCKHFFKDTFGEAAMAEIKALKESGTSVDDIAKKVEEMVGKITDEKKKAIATKVSVNCKKIFSASRRRRDHAHNSETYKEYFTWMTPEQGASVKALRESGDLEGAYAKMNEYYDALVGDKKNEATEKLKGGCKHFFKDTFGEAAVAEFKAMKETGTSVDDIAKKVEEMVGKITDEKKKAIATKVSVNCKKIFSASRKRRDNAVEEYKQFFAWLTPEQGAAVKALRDSGADEETIEKKLQEYFEATTGDKRTEATNQLKGACRHFFKESLGEAAVAEFKAMKESGTSVDDISKKVEEFIGKITDETKKAKAAKAAAKCKKLFVVSRRRRDHDDHAPYKEYFAWLTPEQGAAVKALHDAGDEEGAQKKVHEYYEATTGDKRTEATNQLKGACRHFFKDTLGAAAVEEFKQMKESGTSVDDISKKVDEFIGKITDETKKAKAVKHAGNCKKLFAAARKRRDHAEHEAYKQYFTWLTAEQATEVKALRESGAAEEVVEKKVSEFFEATTGDKRTEATNQLKGACRHFFGDIFGEAAVAEFKAMKESGTPVQDIVKKVEEMVGKITDEKKKGKATKASNNCKKLFGASRKRRDHKHTVDEAMTEFLPWLTAAQQAEIKTLKESGADEKIGDKIMEFYEAVAADKKEEAKTKLQAGCRHYLKHLIGAAAAEEMKELKESGATPADMAKKLEEIIGKMADGADKKKAEGMSKNCKKVYDVSRKRRHGDHKHTMDESITEFLPWLTDAQKAELKTLKESGADAKVGEKIMEFYDNVDPSKKEEAKNGLQAGCKHFISHLIGPAASAEMKALKESGSSPADMATKLEELIGKMPEGDDKKKAAGMTKNCKKVYGLSRKRRHEHTLEEGFAEFLPWTTEEQKMELKNMKEAGAADKIGDKVIEYYEAVPADKKEEARTKLQAGCRHYLKHLLGEAVSGEMKAMHESGSSPVEMAKKLDEIINKMEDGEKKTKAVGLSKNCRKVYGVESRKRRNLYGEYDERYQKYYSWLKDEQKDELAELQDSGEDDELLDKVAQYFKDLEEAKKEEARGQLKMGCRMRMRDLLGEEKAEEIRRMKDEGATKGEMLDRVAKFVEEMGEGSEKESARRSYRHCAKILGRQRRANVEPPKTNFADFTRWLKPEQRKELNDIIRSESVSSNDMYGKLFEYMNLLEGAELNEATRQMRGACKHLLFSFLGTPQTNKLIQMKQTGKKWPDIQQTLDGMVKLIEDEGLRTKAQTAFGHCKQVWSNE